MYYTVLMWCVIGISIYLCSMISTGSFFLSLTFSLTNLLTGRICTCSRRCARLQSSAAHPAHRVRTHLLHAHQESSSQPHPSPVTAPTPALYWQPSTEHKCGRGESVQPYDESAVHQWSHELLCARRTLLLVTSILP